MFVYIDENGNVAGVTLLRGVIIMNYYLEYIFTCCLSVQFRRLIGIITTDIGTKVQITRETVLIVKQILYRPVYSLYLKLF